MKLQRHPTVFPEDLLWTANFHSNRRGFQWSLLSYFNLSRKKITVKWFLPHFIVLKMSKLLVFFLNFVVYVICVIEIKRFFCQSLYTSNQAKKPYDNQVNICNSVQGGLFVYFLINIEKTRLKIKFCEQFVALSPTSIFCQK